MSGDLYHEAIVRLARAARGAGRLAAPDATVTLDNPLCGDRVTLELRLVEGRVAALAHRVRGCLLCEAAASVIGEAAVGAAAADALEGRAFLEAVLGGGSGPKERWRELEVFTPVASVPSRHRCVLLPFEALCAALTGPSAAAPQRTGPR